MCVDKGFPFNLAPDFFLRLNTRNTILICMFKMLEFFSYLLITALFSNKKNVFQTFSQQSTIFYKCIDIKVIIKLIFIKLYLFLFKHNITCFWFLLFELFKLHCSLSTNTFFLSCRNTWCVHRLHVWSSQNIYSAYEL